MYKLPSLDQISSYFPNSSQILTKIPVTTRAQLIDFMPKILRPAFQLCPFTIQKTFLLAALNSVFKEAIEDDDFEFLQGKWVKVSVTDLGLNWWISFENNK